jgi:hypothetical protein
VTTKAWFGCLKCRWLPFDRISTHRCFSSKRITSRTFMGITGFQYALAGVGDEGYLTVPLAARNYRFNGSSTHGGVASISRPSSGSSRSMAHFISQATLR